MSFPSNPNDNDIVERFGRKLRYRANKRVWEVVSSPTVAPIQEAVPTTSSVAQIDNLPMSGNEIGAMSYVQESNRLYVWNGSGWFEIALVNTTPTFSNGAEPSYSTHILSSDTVITLDASDPEGIPLTYDYSITSGSLQDTTVEQSNNVFTISPGSIVTSFGISFTASDGVNIATSSSTFNIINDAPVITTPPLSTYDLAIDGTPTVITLAATDPEGQPVTWSYSVTSGSLGNSTITQNNNVFTITPSTDENDAGEFSITFSVTDGVNTTTAVSSFGLEFPAVSGQQAYTTAGTYSWEVPAGVTSISVVTVGGGGAAGGSGGNIGGQGGSGGGLSYQNNIPVTPGESLTVNVGAGGTSTTGTGGDGGISQVKRGSTVLIHAEGGNGGLKQTSGYQAGGLGGAALGYDGGGNGGQGGQGDSNSAGGGGGGAGGYSGNGGNGGYSNSNTGQTSGSGGGGGGGEADSLGSGGGGGVGIYGEGPSGGATGDIASTSGGGGYGGSGGEDGQNHNGSASGQGKGGAFGGGGGADEDDSANKGGNGGGGAVRIIWGPDRAFPSTNTQDV